jgi:UDP:flavonoid glycosyltransferase YjiC (YdhE family)
VADANLPFAPAESYGGRGGFSVVRWHRAGLAQCAATLRAGREIKADVVITSVLCPGVLLAAEMLDIPAVVIGLSVHLWSYRAGGGTEPQPATSRTQRTRGTLRLYDALRDEIGIAGRSRPANPLYGEALLLRGDPVFEYPGAVLPDRVHHVGPLTWEPAADQAEVEAVRTHLDQVGKPVVYVHLGRFFGKTTQWPRLNAAFTGGPFQAVVEQGRSTHPQPAPDADILLVHKPWMGPLIDRAGLVLTSGTTAPVLAALLRGRPLGFSPDGAEQPVLAAACVRAGVGVYFTGEPGADPPAPLRSVWRDRGVRERARKIGHRLAMADSASRAADIVEQVTLQKHADIECVRT